MFRSNFVKYGVVIDNDNSASITKDQMESLEIGKALTDLTSHGKMKDQYPLEIYSADNILKSIENGNWNFVFYSLPFNLMINAIRNPYISHDLRMHHLETCYYFILHYLYQFNESIAPPSTRITLIRMINTIVGISVALKRYKNKIFIFWHLLK